VTRLNSFVLTILLVSSLIAEGAFHDSDPCGDGTMYEGIAEKKTNTRRRDDMQSLTLKLVFCSEFFCASFIGP
jgi:hypothetical protein